MLILRLPLNLPDTMIYCRIDNRLNRSPNHIMDISELLGQHQAHEFITRLN